METYPISCQVRRSYSAQTIPWLHSSVAGGSAEWRHSSTGGLVANYWLPGKAADSCSTKYRVRHVIFCGPVRIGIVELTGTPVTKLSSKAATPFIDESNAFMKEEKEGVLPNVALKILMKILYVARYCRPDLLRATCVLARRVSKWTSECDRRLHRLVSYMHNTKNYKQYAFVGYEFADCIIALFADADFAGDKSDSTSTSGVFFCRGWSNYVCSHHCFQ